MLLLKELWISISKNSNVIKFCSFRGRWRKPSRVFDVLSGSLFERRVLQGEFHVQQFQGNSILLRERDLHQVLCRRDSEDSRGSQGRLHVWKKLLHVLTVSYEFQMWELCVMNNHWLVLGEPCMYRVTFFAFASMKAIKNNRQTKHAVEQNTDCIEWEWSEWQRQIHTGENLFVNTDYDKKLVVRRRGSV